MKLKFKHQQFQIDAARAVTDVFQGQPNQSMQEFTHDMGRSVDGSQDMFDVVVEEVGDGKFKYGLEIRNKESKFFRYLINSSRLYWRKEIEYPATTDEERREARRQSQFCITSPKLTIDEQEEQKVCLLSKMSHSATSSININRRQGHGH